MSEQLKNFLGYLLHNVQKLSLEDYAIFLARRETPEYFKIAVLLIGTAIFLYCLAKLFKDLEGEDNLFYLIIIAVDLFATVIFLELAHFRPIELRQVAEIRCKENLCTEIKKEENEKRPKDFVSMFIRQGDEIKRVTKDFLRESNISTVEKIAIRQCLQKNEIESKDVELLRKCIGGKISYIEILKK